MQACPLSRDEVIERIRTLPSFPDIVLEILATLDDPESNLKLLVDHIQHDPVIAARVLSSANVAAVRTQRVSAIRDTFTAVSLIGMGSVREMALISSIADFVGDIASDAGMSASYWRHSVAVGVCSQELALCCSGPVSVDVALIAGLLHDIGQLWLHRFKTDAFGVIWKQEISCGVGIEQAERDQFGTDHASIGAWLAEHWGLPANLVSAIRCHHAPDKELAEPLVPVVHVAEVLSNALDISGRDKNRVTSISSAACNRLGLVWNEGVRPLFGRMEARSRHANALFGT